MAVCIAIAESLSDTYLKKNQRRAVTNWSFISSLFCRQFSKVANNPPRRKKGQEPREVTSLSVSYPRHEFLISGYIIFRDNLTPGRRSTGGTSYAEPTTVGLYLGNIKNKVKRENQDSVIASAVIRVCILLLVIKSTMDFIPKEAALGTGSMAINLQRQGSSLLLRHNMNRQRPCNHTQHFPRKLAVANIPRTSRLQLQQLSYPLHPLSVPCHQQPSLGDQTCNSQLSLVAEPECAVRL